MCNWASSNPTVINCTFSGNSVVAYGGGIYNYFNSSSTLTNCIFWGNTAKDGPQIGLGNYSTVSISYSDLEGGQTAIHKDPSSSITWGAGNINSNPIFADADLRLSINSPCIDAGDNTAVPVGLTAADLDNHHRFEDGDCNATYIVDMGAYEFGWVYMGDLDGDCDIDYHDFAVMAAHWLVGK
jgi:hypothetical protein